MNNEEISELIYKLISTIEKQEKNISLTIATLTSLTECYGCLERRISKLEFLSSHIGN